MLTLMILVTATWLGLYIAKRITRHLQLLAAAADEIRAGHLDYRVDVSNRDEFGSLAESFNRMAAELSASRTRLERSSVELEAKHVEVEHRRRYVETVLERLATGVLWWTPRPHPHVELCGHAPLDNRRHGGGEGVTEVFGAAGLESFAALRSEGGCECRRPQRHESDVTRVRPRSAPVRGHLAAARRRRVAERCGGGVRRRVAPWCATEGCRVREVARRLAHEIKNP